MTNKNIYYAFKKWAAGRRGGIPGLIATICLTGAAIMVLTQAVGRQVRSIGRASARGEGADDERRIDEGRWRLDVSRKLEELLSRVRDVSQVAAEPDSD